MSERFYWNVNFTYTHKHLICALNLIRPIQIFPSPPIFHVLDPPLFYCRFLACLRSLQFCIRDSHWLDFIAPLRTLVVCMVHGLFAFTICIQKLGEKVHYVTCQCGCILCLFSSSLWYKERDTQWKTTSMQMTGTTMDLIFIYNVIYCLLW